MMKPASNLTTNRASQRANPATLNAELVSRAKSAFPPFRQAGGRSATSGPPLSHRYVEQLLA